MSELKRKTPLRKKAFAEREIKPETKQPRKKTCAVCKIKFPLINSMAKVCSTPCATEYAKQVRLKKERKEDKERKQKLKTRSEHLKELQDIFNKWVRERDYGLPCISCGQPGGTRDAGHFKSVGGYPELRYEHTNVNSQCVFCNQHKGGNIHEYRKGLKERYGQHVVDWLEGPHPALKLSLEDIEAMKKHYRKATKELIAKRADS